MLAPLLLGSLILVINMVVQVYAVVTVIGMYIRRIGDGGIRPGIGTNFRVVSVIFGVLFLGHLLQFAAWALLFVFIGEFQDFETAFYHSSVNFTSLGYGDIVMSERWRLLGGLEAANGVLMFGLSAGAVLSVMNHLFVQRTNLADILNKDHE
ncbi:ion channel [Marinihelvus fidelis]|nr:ion channel [Marinihelvus fidelis]